MMSDPVFGQCQLCDHQALLVAGHVWSSFGYKYFVSDQSKGGSFVDLTDGRMSNSQYKQNWFCCTCDNVVLGETEKYASELCRQLERDPVAPLRYDIRLLRFATSISWRTVKYFLKDSQDRDGEIFRPACKQWKNFLRDKKRDVVPYSQHLFVAYDQRAGLHKAMGGQLFPQQKIVLSRIGPLIIVALLSRKELNAADRKVWGNSQLLPNGGTVTPVSSWSVGRNITQDLVYLLCNHEADVTGKLLEMAPLIL